MTPTCNFFFASLRAQCNYFLSVPSLLYASFTKICFMDVLVASWAVEAIICGLDVTYSLSGTPIYLFCLLLITLRCVSERLARHPASRRFPTLAACLGFLPGLGQEMQWLQCTQLPALLSSVSTARILSLATNTEVITDFCFGVADLLGIKQQVICYRKHNIVC